MKRYHMKKKKEANTRFFQFNSDLIIVFLFVDDEYFDGA